MGPALLNLITNAIEACEEKTYSPDEDPVVQVLVKQEGNSLLFILLGAVPVALVWGIVWILAAKKY